MFPDFPELHAQGFAGLRCEKPVVMIAMTPRTGSTHLCAALAATPGLVPPTEIFNPRGLVHAEMARRGVKLFAEFIHSFNDDPGPCLIFKTSWQDFLPFRAGYKQLFPRLRVIYLDRRDIFAQTVSLYRARRSGIWHVTRDKPVLAEPPDITETIDKPELWFCYFSLLAEQSSWRYFFQSHAIQPALLVYEDFAADVRIALKLIADFLNIPLNVDLGPNIGFQKLSDELTIRLIPEATLTLLGLT